MSEETQIDPDGVFAKAQYEHDLKIPQLPTAAEWPFPTGKKPARPFEEWWDQNYGEFSPRVGRADAIAIFQAGRASLLGELG